VLGKHDETPHAVPGNFHAHRQALKF